MKQYEDLPLGFRVRRRIRHGRTDYQRLKIKIREKLRIGTLPDFMIIGAQKSGTSSFFINLDKHPLVIASIQKEPHYFDSKFHRPISWYKAHFPSKFFLDFAERILNRKLLSGEATPAYFSHPHVEKRVAEQIPNVKIIVMLRNPVNRAYSHYFHIVGAKKKKLATFEELVKRDLETHSIEIQRAVEDENYWSPQLSTYSFISRGLYVDCLKRWTSVFPREQFLIIKSEDYFEDSQAVYKQALEFLGLTEWYPKNWKHTKFKGLQYPKIDPEIKNQLNEFYAPYNDRLYEFLGEKWDW